METTAKAAPKTKRSRKAKTNGRSYSEADKKRVLAIALKEGLTGAEVQKRFGISQLTFYRWRGPVRGAKAKRGPGRPAGSKNKANGSLNFSVLIRDQIVDEVRRALPGIIKQEMGSLLR